MSGHSKWNTIKRAKGAADAKRGNVFTKLGRMISIAIKTGGGSDPNFNFKLRMAVDRAREAGMPKDNIERALQRGKGEGKDMVHEVVCEGYGPAGSALIVEAVTENNNRTTQNIRTIFNKNNGRMGEQGSVAWMFESRGQIFVEKQVGTENLELELIDQGVEDVKESEEGFEIYTLPTDLEKTKKFIEGKGIKILSSELIMRPQQLVEVSAEDAGKIQGLIDALNSDDDVVNVHSNVNL
jgi:YebC/PmpR family DNA-binding regulatory protein